MTSSPARPTPRVWLLRSWTVVALVALAGPPLGAQTTTSPSSSVVPLQLGPVSLYPSIVLRDVGIDSNVFNASAAEGPKSDFTLTVDPRLQAALPIGLLRLVGTASAGFVYFQTYKDQQSANHLYEARLETTTVRLRPFLSAGRQRSRERVGFEIDARALRVQTNVMAGTDFEMTPITALTAWVRRETLTYGRDERFVGADLGDQLDRTSTTVAAGTKLSVTPLTTIVIAAEIQRDRFATSPLRDSDSIRLAPAVEFAEGAAITGRASAGFREFRPLNPLLPRFRGLVASAGTRFSIRGATIFDVEASRDVAYSVHEADPFYLSSGGGVTVTQRLVGPLDLIALGARRRLRYQALGGALLDGRVEDTTTVGGGVGFRVGQYLRVRLTYDVTDRTSSEASTRDYDRRRVLASLNYGL